MVDAKREQINAEIIAYAQTCIDNADSMPLVKED